MDTRIVASRISVLALVASTLVLAGVPTASSATGAGETLIAFWSGTGAGHEIWVLDPDDPVASLEQVTYPPPGARDSEPIWSPDGAHLVFQRHRTTDNMVSLWRIDRGGTNETQILPWTGRGSGSITAAFWLATPSGERVYYLHDPGGGPCSFNWIDAFGAATQAPTTVSGAETACQADVSPDGDRIVLRYYGGDYAIRVGDLSPDGNTVSGLTTIVPTSGRSELLLPTWSPDGTRIAFTEQGHHIYTVAPDGTGQQQATSELGYHPTWSPDGARIAYQYSNDILVRASDGTGTSTVLTFNTDIDASPVWSPVLVAPTPPSVLSIAAAPTLVEIGSEVLADGAFEDPNPDDTHTATWTWGDGSASAGIVGAGDVTGSHTYADPGVYTVTLTVTDSDNLSGSGDFQYVVVFDPDGGFVTGGGWIDSPPGAYVADASLTGRANFGFVSRYKKGAEVPTGQTQFRFALADLTFHSTSYEWLVVAGPTAKFRGTGEVNGVPGYGFMLTARDAAVPGGGDTDGFRIKIWDAVDTVVYDNKPGTTDDATDATDLGGGSVVIHKN